MVGLDDERRRRAAKNQSLFREVNERIEETVTPSAMFTQFVCECADLSCMDSVAMTVEEYEHVRATSNSFVVAAGHEDLTVEQVIEATDRYLVVAKLAPGDVVATQADPRERI
jgi:hypothetical protein